MDKTLLFIIILSIYPNIGAATYCPGGCTCKWILANLQADCSGLSLTEVPDFADIPVEILDLSNNLLTKFPSELSAIKTLTRLDLTGNSISYMDSRSLFGFTSLNILLLDENNISNWRDIKPNNVLLPAINLQTFSLAGNPLNSFSSSNEDLLLMSTVLKILDLSNCKITTIGRFVLQGLVNLERLILNGNPLRNYAHITSDSLKVLDMSNCGLSKVQPNALADIRQLVSVNFSRNPGIILTSKPGEYAKSDTVKYIDLSDCNMDSMNISGFPNLTAVNLKGNMIKMLSSNSFESNRLIEDLDISNNAIAEIELDTFASLQYLKRLDISYNSIPRIDRNIFSNNEMLTIVNLSRNFINRLSKITAKSLTRLNLSGCEILSVDQNALAGMPKLVELDLSFNLISHFPDAMESETLQMLNLSMCRLTSIRNTTFANYRELISLSLSGNRFTTPFQIEYFKGNPYLYQISLGDNPWRCDCQDASFMKFYLFITQRPAKINDKKQLKCASPDAVYGQSWEQACFRIWFQSTKVSASEKMWSISMVTIIILSVLLCIVVGCRRHLASRRRRRNERELSQNLEEQRQIMRTNRLMLEQEAQLNAPDPTETLPPCYEDALLMPKLEREFKSMVDLNGTQSKRKSLSSKRNETDVPLLDYRRFQSEEILTVRDRERTLAINTTRRTGRIDRGHLGSRLLAAEDTKFPASYLKSQNLESAEKIANFQSHENSPYSRRKPKLPRDDELYLSLVRTDPKIIGFCRKNLENSDSVEIIASFESMKGSPYSRRKPKEKTSISQWTLSSSIDKDSLPRSSSINLVEGHFSRPHTPSSSSSEFQIMNRNSPESFTSDPAVIVHQQKSSQI